MTYTFRRMCVQATKCQLGGKIVRRLVIKPPTKGRTTVSLVTHRYLNKAAALAEGKERGTETIYLGSFPLDLNPHTLDGVAEIAAGDSSAGITLRPEALWEGMPFVLYRWDVQEIRTWLLTFGTWAQREKEEELRKKAREQAQAEERASMKTQLRLELLAEIRPQIRAELEQELIAQRGHPIDDAIKAVEAAAKAVLDEAGVLQSQGHRIVARKMHSIEADPAVATLLAKTVALRKGAVACFESACKATGLMASRVGIPKRKT